MEWHRYEYNESNQMISEKLYNGKKTTSLTYTYDADGNRISETGRIGTDKVNKTYEYTVENRLAAVHDGDELLLAAAYDGDGNRVFLLNYNLHTDDDWKGNSGNGNGNNKDNSGSGNKGNGESGLLNNRAGQIFLDYGDIVMGPAVKTPADIIVIRETVKGNSDSKKMQRTATAGFYAGFVGQGIEYTQIISNADYQLSMIITSAKGVNSINNPLSYLLFIKDFSLTQTLDAAKAGLQDAWNGTYDSAIGRKIGAGTFNYLLMTIGGAQLKGKGNACEAVESGSKSGSGSKFQEIFDLADNYTLSDDTFDNHILDRHGPNSTYGNKSHFNADFDIRDSIDSTLTGDNFIVGPNTAGREGYIFEQTFSNPIGTNSKGKPLYTLKVVIDEAGNVITAFPKK